MYRDGLHSGAKLIVQGQQAWVSDLAGLWSRLTARLGIKAAKSSKTDLRLH